MRAQRGAVSCLLQGTHFSRVGISVSGPLSGAAGSAHQGVQGADSHLQVARALDRADHRVEHARFRRGLLQATRSPSELGMLPAAHGGDDGERGLYARNKAEMVLGAERAQKRVRLARTEGSGASSRSIDRAPSCPSDDALSSIAPIVRIKPASAAMRAFVSALRRTQWETRRQMSLRRGATA